MNLKKYFLFILMFVCAPAFAAEPYSWEGTYEIELDSGMAKTVTVSVSDEGKYQATVKWQGPGTKNDILLCDGVVTADKKTLVLLYNKFDNPYLGTPGVNAPNPSNRKTTDDGRQFTKGQQYMKLTRQVQDGGDIFVPAPAEGGKNFEKTSD